MKSSELIREAKKHLARTICCCFAIRWAGRGNGLEKKSDEIEYYIRTLLVPHCTLGEWIVDNGITDWDTFTNHQYEYRLRWLEHLAQQYEAKGD